METVTVYIGFAIMGIFTGLGNALGAYISNKWLITKIEQLPNKIKEALNNGKN